MDKRNNRGLSVHFEHLNEFLKSQQISLAKAGIAELTHRYVGNNAELRSRPVELSFDEVDQLLEQARYMQQ